MLDKTPAPIRAEKALEMRLPQKRIAFRVVSSLRVYHFDKIMRAPGRKAASVNPRKNRMTTISVKFLALPERVEMRPQTVITADM